MTWAAEIAKRAGVKLAPVITITVGGDTLRFSLQGRPAATSSGHFQDRIISISGVRREMSSPTRALGSQGFTMTLANADKALSAYDPDAWEAATVAYQVCANDQVQTIFSGIVSEAIWTRGQLSLSVVDQGDDSLGDQAKWWTKLSPTDWPGLDPDSVGLPMPLVLGEHDSVAAGFAGMVPCIKLSPLRYLVAGHACAAVHRVFVAGVPQSGGYTVDLGLSHSGGVNSLITVIDFTTAPSGAVTADVKGLTGDLTASGVLVTNPASQAELLREEVFGLADSYVDSTLVAAAVSWCAAYHIRGAIRFASTLSPREILGQLLGSAGLGAGWTTAGKLAYWAPTLPLDTSGATKIDALRDTIPGGFTLSPAGEDRANHLTVNFLANPSGGGYLGQFVIQDADSQTALGRTIKRELNLPAAADELSAWGVAQHYLRQNTRARTVRITAPLHLAAVELGEVVLLTDPWAPDSGGTGWSDRPVYVRAVEFDPAQGQVIIEGLDAADLISSVDSNGDAVGRALGSPAVLGDSGSLPSSWPGYGNIGAEYLFLCDESSGQFASGEAGKVVA